MKPRFLTITRLLIIRSNFQDLFSSMSSLIKTKNDLSKQSL